LSGGFKLGSATRVKREDERDLTVINPPDMPGIYTVESIGPTTLRVLEGVDDLP
jgi:hypothetical protein